MSRRGRVLQFLTVHLVEEPNQKNGQIVAAIPFVKGHIDAGELLTAKETT